MQDESIVDFTKIAPLYTLLSSKYVAKMAKVSFGFEAGNAHSIKSDDLLVLQIPHCLFADSYKVFWSGILDNKFCN